jgi:hypothetical protein
VSREASYCPDSESTGVYAVGWRSSFTTLDTPRLLPSTPHNKAAAPFSASPTYYSLLWHSLLPVFGTLCLIQAPSSCQTMTTCT